MTPANIAGMCALASLDVVALTDHNSCGNCAAFGEAARSYGLLALPGMELTTLEEVHVICLFPDLEAAAAFSKELEPHLPTLPNDVDIFGPQILMDSTDGILGEESRMLAGATDIGVYDVWNMVARYGGVAWPAHVDRPSFSLISNLGLWDSDMGFPLTEISRACPDGFLERRPDFKGVQFIMASDAHYLDQIMDAHQSMDIKERTAQAVLDWLRQAPAIDLSKRSTTKR